MEGRQEDPMPKGDLAHRGLTMMLESRVAAPGVRANLRRSGSIQRGVYGGWSAAQPAISGGGSWRVSLRFTRPTDPSVIPAAHTPAASQHKRSPGFSC